MRGMKNWLFVFQISVVFWDDKFGDDRLSLNIGQFVVDLVVKFFINLHVLSHVICDCHSRAFEIPILRSAIQF